MEQKPIAYKMLLIPSILQFQNGKQTYLKRTKKSSEKEKEREKEWAKYRALHEKCMFYVHFTYLVCQVNKMLVEVLTYKYYFKSSKTPSQMTQWTEISCVSLMTTISKITMKNENERWSGDEGNIGKEKESWKYTRIVYKIHAF